VLKRKRPNREDGGSVFFRNIGICLQGYKVSMQKTRVLAIVAVNTSQLAKKRIVTPASFFRVCFDLDERGSKFL
jgi:hypothetical protein